MLFISNEDLSSFRAFLATLPQQSTETRSRYAEIRSEIALRKQAHYPLRTSYAALFDESSRASSSWIYQYLRHVLSLLEVVSKHRTKVKKRSAQMTGNNYLYRRVKNRTFKQRINEFTHAYLDMEKLPYERRVIIENEATMVNWHSRRLADSHTDAKRVASNATRTAYASRGAFLAAIAKNIASNATVFVQQTSPRCLAIGCCFRRSGSVVLITHDVCLPSYRDESFFDKDELSRYFTMRRGSRGARIAQHFDGSACTIDARPVSTHSQLLPL